VAINGEAVHNSADAQAALDKLKVGDKVSVTIERNDQRQDVQVQLTARE
jgi:PDZ domain-containing secreted protein